MALIFHEGFSYGAPKGTFLERYPHWDAYPYPWKCTDKIGTYDPHNLYVKNGRLNVRLWTDPNKGPTIAAPYPVLPRDMVYGRFQTRMRADIAHGYKIAILLWPWSDKWPDDGEIDFPECNLDGARPYGFVHHADPNGGQDAFSTNVRITDWHIYEVEWRETFVSLKVDGIEIGRSTKKVPNTPMRWMLQCETSGKPDPKVEGRVQFGWVRVYS